MVRKKAGFSLMEIIIALGVLGLIAAFTLPHLLVNTGSTATQVKFQNTQQILSSALGLATAKIGLLPTSQGPGAILNNYMNTAQFCSPAAGCQPPIMPAACQTALLNALGNANNNFVANLNTNTYFSYAVLKDGTQIYGLSPTWNTGLYDAQENAVNPVCVVIGGNVPTVNNLQN